MADTNHIRRDDYVEFSENDPFAELARIMGHDPRVQEPAAEAQPAHVEPAATSADAAADEDDFGIDLERELAGEFDFAEFEEPAPVADWRDETTAPAAGADAPAHDEPVSLDAGFDEFFRESEAPASQDHAQASSPAVAQDEDVPAAIAEDDLEDALERELFAEPASFEPEAAPQGEAAYAAYDEPAAEPVYDYDAPVYDAPAYDPPAARAADAGEPEADAGDEAWTADAEFDLDFLERELAASSAPAVAASSAADAPAAYAAAQPDPVPEAVSPEADYAFEEPAAEPAPAALSLEEELNLLLADDGPPVAAAAASVAPFAAAAAPAAVSAERPAISYFGRANFAAPQPAAAPAAAVAYRPEPAESAAAAPAFEPEPVQAAAPAYAPAAEPAFEPAPAANAPRDELDDIFGDDFAFDLDGDGAPAKADASLPEVETVEVAETVQPVVDDLDIPEVDYGKPDETAPRLYDDLDADFANVFGDLGMEQPTQPQAAASTATAAAPAQQPQAQPYVLDETQWQAAQAFPEADFDYETDLEQAIAMSTYDDEEAQPAPRRRGLLIAAVLAGVAVVGGAGVLGMSMFGGGSDTPALVRADPEPMKVRPENPGGTTVPNQDNEVYQRVTGGASDAAPEQERLITTAEEPVDVAARTAPQEPPSVLAPGIDDEEALLLPKSEDRIEPAPEAASPVTAGETAVVTPRRVRTMVVRPDGTMVPREEPAAAEQPAAAPQLPAAPATAELQPVLPAPTVENAPALEADEGPTLDMPETVAVVPTQRSEPQAAPARTPAPQPAVQQPAAQAPVAAAPVSAPAAAAPAGAVSEWSMQIASQPTAEGAQSTYQDLARRYGSVLEGRGVNIVRADIEGRGTYYRVRIPASSRDEAIQLCTRYKAAGGSCFVSR